MRAQLGGKVESGHHREFGRSFLEIEQDCPLFEGLWSVGSRHQVWMSHGDRVTAIPARLLGRRHLAERALCLSSADKKRKYYAVQFHPEVVHTPDGAKLIANFVHHIAGIKGDWTDVGLSPTRAVEAIRKQVRRQARHLRPVWRRRQFGCRAFDP